MKETTLRDELNIQKGLLVEYKIFPPDVYSRLLCGVRGSLHTLGRLSEDVDESVREECEKLLSELRV